MAQDSSQEHIDFLHSAEERIQQAFPLLGFLRISERTDSPTFPVPFFVALIAAIAESAKKPCCVILPDKTGVTLTVGLLLALHRFRRDAPDILRKYASISFQPGERVLVHPSELVFEYGGFFNSEFFKLKVLDRNESRSLHVREVARLENTTRRRPKGYLNSDLGVPCPSILGTVVGVRGSVNRNLLQNYVAILSSKKAIGEQIRQWRIETSYEGIELSGNFEEVIPAGEITEDGSPEFFDAYVTSGEPLIAIASRPEDLATYCTRVSRHSKLVVIDEVERLTRNIQAYDAIADNQPILIISDATEHVAISDLHMRGCQVWDMTADEILINSDSTDSSSPFRNTFRKAANMKRLVVSASSCASLPLEKAADAICAISRSLPRESDNSLVRELFFSLFGMVTSCAEFLGQPASLFRHAIAKRLEHTKTLMSRAAPWLPPALATQLHSSITEISDAIDLLLINQLTPKGEMLLRVLSQVCLEEARVALAVPSDIKRDEMQAWISAQKHSVPVLDFSELPENTKLQKLILIAWPNAKRFDTLMRTYATQTIDILAYSFERKWLQDYQLSFISGSIPALNEKRKTALLSMLPADETGDDEIPESEPEHPSPFQLPEERFLTRRKISSSDGDDAGISDAQCDAYYVDFVGSSFAYVTDGHELSVVSKFVGDSGVSSAAVKNSSLKEIKEGDYILFRKSGDSDILRFIAEDMIGAATYKTMRDTATRWRAAMQRIGTDPRDVWLKLQAAGLTCHILTVRNWVTDQHMIAPKKFDNIRLIARAAGDETLISSLSEVQKAIDQIKSLHIRAGFRLTEMLREALPTGIQAIGEREIELDLVFGSVWIVRIAEIERSVTQCSRSLVNRLLWDKTM